MYGDVILLILVLLPVLGAFICRVIGRGEESPRRDILADIVTVAELAIMLYLFIRRARGGSELTFGIDGICGMGLNLELDGFRCLYGTIAAFMWAMTCIFSRQYFTHYTDRGRFYMYFLMTLGATMGVFLSADLFSVFIFFEIMSFTSFVWVAHDETDEAMRAAYTYLTVAIIGGLVTLMGLFMLYNMLGTLTLSELPTAVDNIRASWTETAISADTRIIAPSRIYLTGGLIAFGFAVKAGVFPMHIWLPKAHPVAPAPASALLSGILTKTGIFGLLAVSCNMFKGDGKWGYVVMWLGLITMLLGALLAIFSVNLKRTLACSSMSQIGFITVGIGLYALLGDENVTAARGTVLHMVNHSLIKLVLFMAAGVIYMNIHELDLNEIRGYGRRKLPLAICFAIGAASISGIPLTGGYVSKTLLHEAIVEYRNTLDIAALTDATIISGNGGSVFALTVAEWIFLISGGMTLCYMLKLFIAIFIERNNDSKLQAEYDDDRAYWNMESKCAIVIPSAIMLIMGLLPYIIMNRLAAMAAGFMRVDADLMRQYSVRYYSLKNLGGAGISIAIGLILYLVVVRGARIRASYVEADGRTTRHAFNGAFMRYDESGQSFYVNSWNPKLDLEELIYRPLLLNILPAAVGFISAILSQLTDTVIILLRRTTHRQISTRIETGSLDDHLAVVTGSFLDRLIPRRDGGSYIPALVEQEERAAKTQRVIAGSLSFGLILVCVGLILVLIYTLTAA